MGVDNASSMSRKGPSFTLKGSEYTLLWQPCVYGWKRGSEYLYIGLSSNILNRIRGHHVLHRDSIEETDEIQFWFTGTWVEAESLEKELIAKLLPSYNTIDSPSPYKGSTKLTQPAGTILGTRKCICGKEFQLRKPWQLYCSQKCKWAAYRDKHNMGPVTRRGRKVNGKQNT